MERLRCRFEEKEGGPEFAGPHRKSIVVRMRLPVCAHDLVVTVVCNTSGDGSKPSVHLRSGVMASILDFGSGNIGSNPMGAAFR